MHEYLGTCLIIILLIANNLLDTIETIQPDFKYIDINGQIACNKYINISSH